MEASAPPAPDAAAAFASTPASTSPPGPASTGNAPSGPAPTAPSWTRVAADPPPPPAPAAPEPAPVAAAAELPPREPELPIDVVDPHGIGVLVPRMSAGSLRTGRVALGILTALLDEGELVESLVQGVYQNQVGVGVVTDRRVLLVNEHEWVPNIRSIPITEELVVQGWQDDRTASLIFVTEDQSIVFSGIADRPLAQEMAHRVRARVADAAASRP